MARYKPMKVYITLWDIMKSVMVVGIVVFLFFRGDGLWAKISDTISSHKGGGLEITEPILNRIAENAVLLQNRANDARFKRLEDKLEDSNSLALKIAKEYARKTDSKITTIGQVVAEMKSSFNTQKPDKYIDKEKVSRSYDDIDIKREMANGEELPVGWVKYHPALKGEDPFTVFNYPLEYYTTVIRSEKDDGTFSYSVDAYVENNYVKSSRGKKFPVHINKVNFEERLISDKRFRFNPRLALSGAINSKNMFPMLNMSLWSYGRTKRDMDLRFFIVGAGLFSDSGTYGAFAFSPVEYNLGNHVPFVENFFLGPTIDFSTNGSVGYGIQFSIPF